MEAFPYERDFTSIGTTDEPWDEAPEKVSVSDKEIDYMLAEVNAFLRKPVTRADIVWSYAGVRPLFEAGGGRDQRSFHADPRLFIRDRSRRGWRAGSDGLRRQAHHASPPCGTCNAEAWRDHALAEAEPIARRYSPGRRFRPVRASMAIATALQARFPWLPEMQANRYVQLYGTRADDLLDGARASPIWALSSAPTFISGKSISSWTRNGRSRSRTSSGGAASWACGSCPLRSKGSRPT